MDKAELLNKIQRIDENVFFSGGIQPGTRAGLIIVGASALLLCDLSHKNATKDVDVLRVEQSIKQLVFADQDFNGQCSAYAQCLPYNFEDRLVKVEIETYVIDIYVPSIEDLAVMKLYRWEQPDKDDLTASEFLAQLDWSQLAHLVYSPNEAEASRVALAENDRELLNLRFNYKEYEEGWRR